MQTKKQDVHAFWNDRSCGEKLYLSSDQLEGYRQQSQMRYMLEPFIRDFADFEQWRDQEVLEIGVGLGADHQSFAQGGAKLTGIDLTERAVLHTQRRFELLGLNSDLRVGDAENLPFSDATFDLVYSWGVLHHSPDTPKAIREVFRVLRPGGSARIMIYNKYSIIGLMLWIRYGLLKFKPWRSFEYLYANYLESPGTKAYSYAAAARLFDSFDEVKLDSVLTHGDLLSSEAGQRHKGILLTLARSVWPRSLISLAFPKQGLFLLIQARKPL